MIYLFKSNRVYRSYFGGKNLDKLAGKDTFINLQFPEEWIASTVRAFNPGREDIIEGLSVCENGEYLSDIVAKDPIGVLGNENYNRFGEVMPILVKLLDSAERLFIQCHPTIEFSKKYFNSQFGKTECWYIISSEDDACVYIGFKKGITKEEWVDCYERQYIDGMLSMMHRIPVKSGDLIFVDGGIPHAIGAGCLLCEIQEPTDYMVIPERKSKSGIVLSDAKMHGGLGFDRMMDCFVYNGYSENELKEKFIRHPNTEKNKLTPIVDKSLTDKFTVNCLELSSKFLYDFGDSFTVGVVLSGNCSVKQDETSINLQSGRSFLITANSGLLEFDGDAKIIFCK